MLFHREIQSRFTNNHNHKMNENEIIHDELSHESGSAPYSSVLVYSFLFSESHFFNANSVVDLF